MMKTTKAQVAKDGTVRVDKKVLYHMLGVKHAPGTDVTVEHDADGLEFMHLVKDAAGRTSSYIPARGGR